jgi:hypothetical protein
MLVDLAIALVAVTIISATDGDPQPPDPSPVRDLRFWVYDKGNRVQPPATAFATKSLTDWQYHVVPQRSDADVHLRFFSNCDPPPGQAFVGASAIDPETEQSITSTDRGFTVTADKTCDAIGQQLLTAILDSPQLDAWARGRSAQDAVRWPRANVDKCLAGKTGAECAQVQAYLERSPAGRHAVEARALLDVAKDEDLWTAAKAEVCRHPKTSQDCDLVQGYVQVSSPGAHASEGQAILAGSRKQIDLLRKSEERAAAVAEITGRLCSLDQQLEELARLEAMQRRVDAASGTVDVAARRRAATARLYIGDERSQAAAALAKTGARYDRKRGCAATGE